LAIGLSYLLKVAMKPRRPPASQYATALRQFEEELAEVNVQRFQLENTALRLEAMIANLKALMNVPVIDPKARLTDSLKTVLRIVYPNGLYPRTARRELEKAGYKLSGTNPMASIHAVLKRLVQQGLVAARTMEKTGKVAYFWNSDKESISHTGVMMTVRGAELTEDDKRRT
jgi:hypothetical protein